MKYCVLKDKTIIVDGSENSEETMLQNALNIGLLESEVEILTEEEFKSRKSLEPVLIPQPTENELLMLAIADLDAQREIDKLETQLAIAELAETLLGGVI